MSTLSTSAVPGSVGHVTTRGRRGVGRISVGLSLFMTAIVVIGFWPSYFGPLTHGLAERHWLINVHGAIYVGWMILLLTQVTLVARGNVAAHRKLGTFGIGYGWLVLAMGLIVSIAAPVFHVKAGDWDTERAAAFLLTPLGDMVLFGAFFGAAVRLRRRPELHKRLMLLATMSLLFAAVGRMDGFVTSSRPLLMLVWLSPLLIAIAHEAVTRRRVHPLYLWALPILVVAPLRLLVEETEVWLPIGRAILAAFM